MQESTIIIVDDHRLMSAGLSALLKQSHPSAEVIECENGRQALQLLDDSVACDLILVDIQMPSFSGMDLLQAIKVRNLNTTIAMISGSSSLDLIQQCLDSGADGYLPKDSSPQLLMEGIQLLLDKKRFVPPHLEAHLTFCRSVNGENKLETPLQSDQSTGIGLKKREKEVLELLMQGKSNKEIAIILGLSQSTIKFHLARLFRKFNVRSRTECISVAMSNK